MKKFFSHPWAIIIVCLAITGVLGFKLKDVKLDNSIRQYFPQKHPSYQRLIDSEDTFGSTVVIGVSLETDKGSIVTPDNVAIIDRITTYYPYIKRILYRCNERLASESHLRFPPSKRLQVSRWNFGRNQNHRMGRQVSFFKKV